jgi:hypothetical protein
MSTDVANFRSTIEEHATSVAAFGYVALKGVYRKEDIQRFALTFDEKFMQDLEDGKVQSRDYRRFACKLPISAEYEPILNNPYIHELMEHILGKDYVLFNFSSHSSLPGSSHQMMHVDSIDSLNTNTFVHNEPQVVFLHIPLIDMNEGHGATEVWPITLFSRKPGSLQLKTMRWVKNNAAKCKETLAQGDVILKTENCVHAGGANRTGVRRHMITLVFARRNCYVTGNSGMIPGGSYDGPGMPRLPYRINAHAPVESVRHGDRYTKQVLGGPLSLPPGLGSQMQFNQYAVVKNAISPAIIDEIAARPAEILASANWTANLAQQVLPAARAAFRGGAFVLHSVTLNDTKRLAGCDDPKFAAYAGEHVFNNADRLIRVHVPLQDSETWVRAYPGNKTLSMKLMAGDPELRDRYRLDFACEKGMALITSGGLVYSRVTEVPTVELTFVRSDFIPSYEDRYRITDVFALSSPKSLGRVLRYDSIYVTQPRYKDFNFYRLNYVGSVVINFIINLANDSPRRATALGLLALIACLPLAPFLLCAVAIRHRKHPVSRTLSLY